MAADYGFISPLTNSFLSSPLTPISPWVNPYATVPSIPVLSGDFQLNTLGADNTDWYQVGKNYMAQMNAIYALQESAQGLVSLESEVAKTKEAEGLTESQKQRLQEILDKIAELKAKIQNAGNKSIDEKQALVKEIEALKAEAVNVAKEISKEIQDAVLAEEAHNPDGTTPSGTVSDNTDKPVAQELSKEEENQALEICQSIYQGAIGVVGTEYGYIINGYNGMQGTSSITKDNVTAVLNKWQEQFAGGSGDDNVIETLFAEEMLWNPSLKKRDADGKISNPEHNVDIIWNIVKCLEERAKELGVYNSLVGQFAVAYDELDDTRINQTKVEDAVMVINQKVTLAENAKKAEDAKAKATEDKKKAEAEKKAKADEIKAKSEAEVKSTFLADMREIWKDDKLELSDKVQYKDGKFVIRIEGRDYYGKDFNELCDNIAKAGYDPKEFLVKKHLKTAA